MMKILWFFLLVDLNRQKLFHDRCWDFVAKLGLTLEM
jgi:hypothetical protein